MVPPWTQPPSCCESHTFQNCWIVFYLEILLLQKMQNLIIFPFFKIILCHFYFFFMSKIELKTQSLASSKDGVACVSMIIVLQSYISFSVCPPYYWKSLIHNVFNYHYCRLSTSERLLFQQSLGQPLQVLQKRGEKVRICVINFEKWHSCLKNILIALWFFWGGISY